METIAKAYGKILVFGAYSILEPGNIGLVVNIDKGTTATVKETETGRIVIDLSNFEIKIEGILENNRLRIIKDHKLFTFTKNAVDYTYKYLNHKNQKIRDIKLISYTDPGLYFKNKLKTGFGSSATSTVSAVAAILYIHGIDDRNLVYKISRYSHYKSQSNLGSGFDIASACFGSHYFLSDDSAMEEDFLKSLKTEIPKKRQSFDWPNALIPVIIFTGQPASTQEMIKKVMDYKKKEPKEHFNFISAYNKINMKAKEAFENNNILKIKAALEESWEMRKVLGDLAKANIENEKTTLFIDELKKNGAFTAGLIGAGGGDSILALCKEEEDKEELLKYLEKKNIAVLEDISIVNQGYGLLK